MTESRLAEEPDERAGPGGRSDKSETARPRGVKREELHRSLEAVWERYGSVVDKRVGALESFIANALIGTARPADVRAAHVLAHKLTGSLGMFGFPEGAEIARRAEGLLAEREEITEPDLHLLSDLIADLRASLSLPRTPLRRRYDGS